MVNVALGAAGLPALIDRRGEKDLYGRTLELETYVSTGLANDEVTARADAVRIAEDFEPYLRDVLDRMRRKGIRVELDASDDRFPKKIRNASKAKVPFILIAGGEDQAGGSVSFRYRDGSQENGVPIEDAIAKVLDAIEAKAQVGSAPV